MSMIEFHDVNKYFGKFQALKNINLTIDRGEVVTIIGPSGSGKSTVLRCINGLERITSGQLIVNDFDLADKKTDMNRIRKNVGMVFQIGPQLRRQIGHFVVMAKSLAIRQASSTGPSRKACSSAVSRGCG